MILIQVLWVHNDSVNTNSTSPGAILADNASTTSTIDYDSYEDYP